MDMKELWEERFLKAGEHVHGIMSEAVEQTENGIEFKPEVIPLEKLAELRETVAVFKEIGEKGFSTAKTSKALTALGNAEKHLKAISRTEQIDPERIETAITHITDLRKLVTQKRRSKRAA